jgi:hypothetical protein
MNRIAEKVVPIMNDQELQSLIVSNYENDAQTLTSDTEANLLKFKELIGQLDEQELERWNDIKKTFQRNVKMRGVGADDRVGQVVVQLSSFSEGLDAIRDAMADGLEQLATTNTLTPELDPDSADDNTPIQPDIANHVAGLRESLDAIRDALADAAARPVAIAVPEPAVPVDDAKSKDDAPRVKIVEPDDPEDEDGEEELDRIGTANTITVVNKIPPSLLKVLRQQFQLMEGWMEPLLKSSQAQQGELKQLREQIETTLDDYERLIGQVRSSKSKRSRARRSDKK